MNENENFNFGQIGGSKVIPTEPLEDLKYFLDRYSKNTHNQLYKIHIINYIELNYKCVKSFQEVY